MSEYTDVRIVGAIGWKRPRGYREASGRIGRQLTPDTAA
jgi:hypothetical protein